MPTTDLVFDKTSLGDLRVRYSRTVSINAETIVETQTKALLFSMRMEARRRQLANGVNNLGAVTYYVGRL